MKPLYIFDLDGTIANCDHRQHYLLNADDPQRWRKFYAACGNDLPNHAVIGTLEALRFAGADIWIFSGRSDEVRSQTEAWLAEHTSFMSWDLSPEGRANLTMREANDYTPDHELKALWLDCMLVEDRNRLIAVFDDRASVVSMWRSKGVACFQVAPGEF